MRGNIYAGIKDSIHTWFPGGSTLKNHSYLLHNLRTHTIGVGDGCFFRIHLYGQYSIKPSLHPLYGYYKPLYIVAKHAAVIGNTTPSFKAAYSPNASGPHMGTQLDARFYRVIQLVVDRISEPDLLFKTDLRNLVTGIFTKLQGLFQRLLLPKIRQEFYFQRQFHAAQVYPSLEYLKLLKAPIQKSRYPPRYRGRYLCFNTLRYFFTKKEPAIPTRSKLLGFLADV